MPLSFELQEILELLSTYLNTRRKFDMVIHLEGEVINKFYLQGNVASRFNPAYLQQVLLEAMLTEKRYYIFIQVFVMGPFYLNVRFDFCSIFFNWNNPYPSVDLKSEKALEPLSGGASLYTRPL